MSIVALPVRKHLSADALFRLVHSGFASLPDHRLDDTAISFTDARMSAFAMVSLKAPALLAVDKERTAGNVPTIYGLARGPCDTPLRDLLAPVSPKWLRPGFTSILRPLQRGKALEPMVVLDGHYGLALDGTADFSSKTRPCASCLHTVHRNGSLTSLHQMVGAAMLHPDRRAVIPLMPEPIVRFDGTATNAGERHAAKRFMVKLRQDHPPLKCRVTEESLRSNAPQSETLHAYALPSILGGKEGEQALLFQQVQAAEHAGRVTSYERHDRTAGLVHRFRFVNDVPLHASRVAVRVNVSESWTLASFAVLSRLTPKALQYWKRVTQLSRLLTGRLS